MFAKAIKGHRFSILHSTIQFPLDEILNVPTVLLGRHDTCDIEPATCRSPPNVFVHQMRCPPSTAACVAAVITVVVSMFLFIHTFIGLFVILRRHSYRSRNM